MTKEDFRQYVSKKIIIARELRRRNFGCQDHKRKAWWTMVLLKKEEENRIKSKQFWADAISYARLRFARKRVSHTNYTEGSQSNTSDRDNENSPSRKNKSWLLLLLRIVIFFGVFCITAWNNFGKEYSSCNAGDGPPKKIQRTSINEEQSEGNLDDFQNILIK